MSFLDDIIDVGKSVLGFFTGNNVVGNVAKSAALGYLLNQVQNSINADNQKAEAAQNNQPDYGVREQVDPDTNHSIPVVYGQAFLGGIVTDAVLSDDNKTMWYCITICEKTGTLMSTGQPSVIKFDEIYWNESRMTFRSDGVTANALTDEDGNTSSDIDGLVKVWFYNNGSASPTNLKGYTNPNVLANNLFPNWGANHTMDELVFVIIRVEYNREKNITGLGNIEFKLKNSMTLPGDVLYDYMTNTRYGAGIVPEEIYSA